MHLKEYNPYQVLGVTPAATPAQIRQAYRKKAATLHPDRPGGDADRFVMLRKSFELLMNTDSRRTWDEDHQALRIEAEHREKVVQDLWGEWLQKGNIE